MTATNTSKVFQPKNRSFPTGTILSLLFCTFIIQFTNQSYFVTNVYNGEVKKTNPCSVRSLASYIKKVNPNKSLVVQVDNPDVQSICPSLKYSCCNKEMIDDLTSQIQKSFDYINFRKKEILKIFKMIKSIARETYTLFLKNRTFADINCYNKIQDEKYNRSKFKFRKNKDILEKLEKTRKMKFFNLNTMESSFAHLKILNSAITELFKKWKENTKNLYGGMVCSICSPNWAKFFHPAQKDESSYLEINKHQCLEVLNNNIKAMEIQIYMANLQTLIDISYCAKKNSMDHLNFGNEEWTDNYIVSIEQVYAVEHNKKNALCIDRPSLFMEDSSKGRECVNMCKNSLSLFEKVVPDIKPFLLARMNIFNIFENQDGEINMNKKLKEAMTDLSQRLHNYDDQGLFDKEKKYKNYLTLHILQPVPNPRVDFSNVEIRVSNFFGINSENTPIDSQFLESAEKFQILLFAFVVLFLFQKD